MAAKMFFANLLLVIFFFRPREVSVMCCRYYNSVVVDDAEILVDRYTLLNSSSLRINMKFFSLTLCYPCLIRGFIMSPKVFYLPFY